MSVYWLCQRRSDSSPSIDINNVGSIAQALYAKTHAVYDDVEASKWQAAQVSILSLGNFAGRVLIGEIYTSHSSNSNRRYARLDL